MIRNILIVPYTHQLGSTHSLIKIGQILKDKGYNILFAGEGQYLELAKNLGFDTVSLPEVPYDRYRLNTDKGQFNYLDKQEILQFIESELKIYKEHSIDLIIDTLRPTTYISSRIYKIPRVSLNYAVLTKYYSLPTSIPEGHFLDALRYFPTLYKVVGAFARKVINLVYYIYGKEYRKVLHDFGLNLKPNWEELVSDKNTYLYDIPDFAPTQNLPDTKKYIGPILLDMQFVKPIWFEEVSKKRIKYNYQVIYLSMGSTGSFYQKLLSDLIHYIKDKKIILIGNYCKLLEDLPDQDLENVYLVDYAPAEAMLDISDLVITHGGRGTIFHSLKHNVPLIGIPHQAEQEWNILRVKELELGDFQSKKRYSTSEFLMKVENIMLNINTYKANVSRFYSKINSTELESNIDYLIKSLSNDKE